MKRPDEKQLAQQRSGHRERVRQRFIQNGLSALQPYEVLEYLLFFLIPRKDVKPIAKELLEKFNTVSGVLDASPDELVEFGLTPKMAADIAFLRELLNFYHFEKVSERPLLATKEDIFYYLQCKLGNGCKEKLMVLFLSYSRHLLGYREYPGTIEQVSASPREISETALLLHASSVVLAHNYPSALYQPSAADTKFSRSLYDALKPLEILLQYHLILTSTDFYSLLE